MQNRYTGDIGDFGKLGLLRALRAEGSSIGVNWYLVPDENHNGDGRHIDYLSNEKYRGCDESLWLELKKIVSSQQRKVSSLENDSILKATFFSNILDFRGKPLSERNRTRNTWNENALAKLRDSDIVFVDPDNGLMVPSAQGTPRANKYVEPKELAGYFAQGSSVIYYQHKARKQDCFYIEQHRRVLDEMNLDESAGLGLKFVSTSQRYYFFILQPGHIPAVQRAVDVMLASPWKAHFRQMKDWRKF